ncbi:MAG: response regulator [Cyclobacteriaceae bacterium]
MTKQKTILIVDDDERNIFALEAVLRSRGFETSTAANGELALETLTSRPNIDLVLMDIMMPIMDGYEAMRAIRDNKSIKNIPVIALTAKAMKGDKLKCLEAGANDYCAKPVDIIELFNKIENCLKE